MRLKAPQALLDFARQAVRRLVGGWTLERKSLLFLGIALVIPIGLAFWFLLQMVAKDLVLQTTRQSARDYARSVIAWRHVEKPSLTAALANSPRDNVTYFVPEVLSILRGQLVDNPSYRHEFLMLDPEVRHDSLLNADLPQTADEREILEKLEQSFRKQQSRLAESRAAAEAQTDATAANPTAQPLEPQPPLPSVEDLFQELGPAFPEDMKDTPPEGWFVYYHAIQFSDNCLVCHQRYMAYEGEDIPFRVVKVMIPFKQTEVASATTLAVMIAIAMVTIVATLMVVHWVLRRIVLNPLQHLKHVSDEISRGNTDLRANIDTDDEFHELGDAFNRMLRHMTEGQEKLRSLNQELDVRVDQLAQANLQLYEANRLKSDFLANMSHELRTPLNSILGFSDVLRDIDSLNDKQRKYVTNIQSSGRILLEMINDILDLAKVEAGKMKVSPTSFALPTLVDAQCNMLQSLVDEKNMDLRCEFSPDLPLVFQDQPKIQQILTNLLSNAIKFTPDGGLVSVQVGLLSEKHFYLTVTDTGVGIPESDFEIIFEKFRQSNSVLQDGGLTRQYSGTGLGLSIVKELCRLLGGEVRLTSQLGTGSTFQVILPCHFHTADVAVEPLSQLQQ